MIFIDLIQSESIFKNLNTCWQSLNKPEFTSLVFLKLKTAVVPGTLVQCGKHNQANLRKRGVVFVRNPATGWLARIPIPDVRRVGGPANFCYYRGRQGDSETISSRYLV